MDCLLDTNILIRGFDRRHPMCRQVREAGKKLYRQGTKFCLAPQNIIESWAVATRPLASNGLGIPVEQVAALIRRFKRVFTVLSEIPDIYAEWERLVVEHQVIGKKVHDARIVAAMNVHGHFHVQRGRLLSISRDHAYQPTERVAAAQVGHQIHRGLVFSSSTTFRIGIKPQFQAHPALESNLDFRLISGLENAHDRARDHARVRR